MEFVLAALGLVILLLAGDLLVRGAVNLSLRVGIPALIVSLTIVAFGTSAPELLISIAAVKDNAPGLALGNVVGSNTANVLLVLGVPALISRLETRHTDMRRSYSEMIFASVVFIIACFSGPLSWVHGAIFLTILAAVLLRQGRDALRHRRSMKEDTDDLEGVDPEMRWWKIVLFLALGIVGLPLGADLLVDGARIIAKDFGVSDSVIGLTLVAVGTSLPELATTVMAALRRQTEVAMGNVIGSNLFNLMAIIGLTTIFGDIPVPESFLRFDVWVMLAASLVLTVFVFSNRWRMGRRWGTVFVGLYAAYVAMVVMA